MGFHVCEYCKPGARNRYPNTSSGDVTLVFESGRIWEMPDMILHYVADHGWLPPAEFVDDVLRGQVVSGNRLQTKSVVAPTRIGYLSGQYRQGAVPRGFVEKLESLMLQAARMGERRQYRGM